MEKKGYGDANHVLYQILKHLGDNERELLENKLKKDDKKQFEEYKEFEKKFDKVKPIKLSF